METVNIRGAGSQLESSPVYAHSVDSLVTAIGLPRSTLYEAIANGDLQSFKVGKRRLVTPAAARAYIEKLSARGG